nr:immunoglobulin light chain junction region [Macaca mulatta]
DYYRQVYDDSDVLF